MPDDPLGKGNSARRVSDENRLRRVVLIDTPQRQSRPQHVHDHVQFIGGRSWRKVDCFGDLRLKVTSILLRVVVYLDRSVAEGGPKRCALERKQIEGIDDALVFDPKRHIAAYLLRKQIEPRHCSQVCIDSLDRSRHLKGGLPGTTCLKCRSHL